MTEPTKKILAPTANTLIFKLRGITYVPHYSKKCYVGPGYGVKREVSASALRAAGATPEHAVLWMGVEGSASLRPCLEANK